MTGFASAAVIASYRVATASKAVALAVGLTPGQYVR